MYLQHLLTSVVVFNIKMPKHIFKLHEYDVIVVCMFLMHSGRVHNTSISFTR
jgi:hypothetical protein